MHTMPEGVQCHRVSATDQVMHEYACHKFVQICNLLYVGTIITACPIH